MYTADLRITAQYQENYGDASSPYWKNKGGVEFILPEVAVDPVLYAAPGDTDRAIAKLLKAKSNDFSNYILISWEFIYSQPKELDTDAFYKEMGIEI